MSMEIKQDLVSDVETLLHRLNFERVLLPQTLERLTTSDLNRLIEILEAVTKRVAGLEAELTS